MWRFSLLGPIFLFVIHNGQTADLSHLSFSLIRNQVPNYPDQRSEKKSITTTDAMQCLEKCADDPSGYTCAFNSSSFLCYISSPKSDLLSKGLFNDEHTSVFVIPRLRNLRDFFFLDVAPGWASSFEYTPISSVDTCSDLCVRHAASCRAFNFFPTNSSCKTYEKSITVNGIPSDVTVKKRNPNVDGMYFERLDGQYAYFSASFGYAVQNPTTKPVVSCADFCLSHSDCVAFSQTGDGSCSISSSMLLSDTISGGDGLKTDSKSIYFEMKRTTGRETDYRFHLNGEITSPGFPIDYPVIKFSDRTVVSQQGMSLSAQLTRINLPRNEKGQCLDQLKVNGIQICDASDEKLLPNKTTDQETINVFFKSTNGSEASGSNHYGFRIAYRMSWDCAGNDSAIQLDAGTLTKLFSPPVDGNGSDCLWNITAKKDKQVALYFVKMPPNKNSITILSHGQSLDINQLKDGIFGRSVSVSYFTSIASPIDSFLLYFREADNNDDIEYSVDQNVTCECNSVCEIKTNDSFADEIKTFRVVNLRYNIETKPCPGNAISIFMNSIGFGHKDIFGDCQEGFIDIYEGRTDRILSTDSFMRFCGLLPSTEPLLIKNTKITVVAKLFNRFSFKNHPLLQDDELKGFSMKIKTGIRTGLYENHISEDTLLKFPRGSGSSYGYNETESWILFGNHGAKTVTRVAVKDVQLATIPNKPEICDNDRLELFIMRLNDRSVTKEFHLFCGENHLNPTRVFFGDENLPISVKFSSDDRYNAKGFSLGVQFTRGYFLSPADGGWSIETVDEDGYLLSARYPNMIRAVNEETATWYIRSIRYKKFILRLEAASKKEPSKNMEIIYPNGTKDLELYSPEDTEMTLPNGTTIVWHLFAMEKSNRFAAKITFVKGPSIQPKSGKLSGGVVAGIVIGCLIIVGVLIAGAVLFMMKRRKTQDGPGPVKFHNDGNKVSFGQDNQSFR